MQNGCVIYAVDIAKALIPHIDSLARLGVHALRSVFKCFAYLGRQLSVWADYDKLYAFDRV